MRNAIGVVCFISSCLGLSASASAGTWKAGAAKVGITPSQFMWMSGYAARTHPSDGKISNLFAKAMVIEDEGGNRALLITMDLIGVTREISRAVCEHAEQKFHIPRSAIMLCASHTHSGPVLESNLQSMFDLDATQQRLVHEYTEELKAKLVHLVDDAADQLVPSRIEFAHGTAGFAVNRRNNKEADVPKLREAGTLKGPVDHDLPVLAVRDESGKLIAIVFGYACHATTLSGYEWCADWPGFAQEELEKDFPGTTALFVAGCGGDQNPIPRRTVEQAKDYGHQAAAGAQAALEHSSPIAPTITTAYKEIDLPFASVPDRAALNQELKSKNPYIAHRAKLELARLDRGETLSPTYPYPVAVWKLGTNLTWVFLGGEVVVDYSLRLKHELGERTTWVSAYSNDVMAYIPSLRVLKEGGYEGGGAMIYYGLPSPWAPPVEEMIVKQVHELAK